MSIFKTKHFAKFTAKHHIDDATLCEAIQRAEIGLIDADLGSGIIKQRIARQGQGKSGGFRTLILYRLNDNHIFVSGFAKNQQENISAQELADLKQLATQLADYSPEQIAHLVRNGILIEVTQ